jgi:hypothetical protein
LKTYLDSIVKLLRNVPTLTQLSKSSTSSRCFIPSIMMRAKRRQEERQTMTNQTLEDKEDINLKLQASAPPSSSAVLPIDEDDKIDLCSDELTEILAEAPFNR